MSIKIRVIEIINKIKNEVQTLFQENKGSHAWDHTQRVAALCQRIGSAEHADLTVLQIAAYLHDIGRSYQDNSNGTICHAEKGAQLAKPLIKDLALSSEQKQNILHCIKAHRFRSNCRPETIEAKALFDADKLDAIGAVGIARAYLFAGELGARLHAPEIEIKDTSAYSKEDTGYREYKVKLVKIKDRIITAEGKKLAKDRHQFMKEFFERFAGEYIGEL